MLIPLLKVSEVLGAIKGRIGISIVDVAAPSVRVNAVLFSGTCAGDVRPSTLVRHHESPGRSGASWMTPDDRHRDLFRRHVESVLTGDADEVATTYARDAVVFHAGGVVRGREAIRSMYVAMFESAGIPPRPSWEAHVDHNAIFAVLKIDEPDLRRSGCETLIVRDDLISLHTMFSLQSADTDDQAETEAEGSP
ncbi:YybH family protein [uncultured Jatrophihabitans sp.]|uniref:YybH family protein n=1 Tax=uncultured Jatrophihabitans sp. TaxID=1610747 RepID=UPI0035CC9459